MTRKILIAFLLIVATTTILYWSIFSHSPGEKIDEWHSVAVYHNGMMSNVQGRNLSSDGYNLGLKWQCVEFVKRYYYESLHHSMPNSYGHAKDFFDRQLKDGQFNPERGLVQYRNGGMSCPEPDDIIIFEESRWNKFGHVAIVTEVQESDLEIIQQNDLLRGTRRKLELARGNGTCLIDHSRILGWLRKEHTKSESAP